MEIQFEELDKADLYIDCIYKGGKAPNMSSEPFHKLIPGCENAGGFRKKLREDGSGKYAYVVLYTSMEELEWPDYLDKETGIFRYYGDNREPGRELTDTKKKGNRILEMAFGLLNEGVHLEDMPPFLIFKKTGNGRDIQFLGLAAPGNPKLSPDRDLVAFWRTIDDNRFQNYEAYFTVLDTGKNPISRKWIESLIFDHDNNLKYAPEAWKRFLKHGRNGIVPLMAPRSLKIPTRYDQLPAGSDSDGLICLDAIRNHYRDFNQGFEICATNLVSKMDPNFKKFSLTRPWRDGGRDALGKYVLSTGGIVNSPLVLDCALEAKCYAANNGVGVKEMSRLISRIRYRQFGIMVTTSYVDTQAYKEVVEDGHPILIVTATDIAGILRKNMISPSNVEDWLVALDREDDRLATYSRRLNKISRVSKQ